MKKGCGIVTNVGRGGGGKNINLHHLVKGGEKDVYISPVTILDRATLTCQHNALMELVVKKYLRIVKRDISSSSGTFILMHI